METERQYLLGKADKVPIVQLHADGFKELSPEHRILVYYLYEAAAGTLSGQWSVITPELTKLL